MPRLLRRVFFGRASVYHVHSPFPPRRYLMGMLSSTLAVLIGTGLGSAAVKSKEIEYEHEGTKLKGYLAYDDAAKGKRPGVLVFHEWWGLNEYAKHRANMLAEMGYVAFCGD